jgi:hypothetical protein
MPMGIVTDKEFDLEKSKIVTPTPSTTREESNSSVPITGEIMDVNRGRGKGSVEVPNSLRNIIGEESAVNGRQAGIELAQQFGVSPSSVSAYDVGATSTSSYDRRPNQPVINQAKERIAKRARGKLMSALHHITKDKLESSNAKDLAGIAKDMSAVVRSMEPEKERTPSEGNNGPTFVFYAPQFRKEEHFEVVHVKE